MSDYDDDERPSWREIDKKRDRSSHVRQEKKERSGGARPGADRYEQGRYKQALEKLFQGKKGTLEYQKLHNAIHKSYGSSTFLAHVQKFIKAYGLPQDVSTLLLILDTKDPDTMLMTIDKLKEVAASATAREKEDIKRKLSILSMTDRSGDVKERAHEVAEELKSLS
ncbi:MAG TPA: hypothetical protein VMT71_14325 [Syntrophorhabdales bacterium]|nr:hypothetical protein [Syntrophorhabdales bacterium]